MASAENWWRAAALAALVMIPVAGLAGAWIATRRARAAALRAQRDSHAQVQLLADNMPALISYLDADLRIRLANASYRTWFGLDPADMIGKRPDEIFGKAVHEQALPFIHQALGGMPANFEREMDTPIGRRTTRTALFPRRDAEGKVIGIYRMTTDVSVERRRAEELEDLARRDALTGLHNRMSFQELLPQAIARSVRRRRLMALLFVDLDRFKAVNDTLGHDAGDAVLKAVAERMVECVRAGDTVVRLGGDEFVVVLEDLRTAEESETVAAKIIAAVLQPIATKYGECGVGASIGIACASDAKTSVKELIKRADEAVYAAKNAGRGRFVRDKGEAMASAGPEDTR